MGVQQKARPYNLHSTVSSRKSQVKRVQLKASALPARHNQSGYTIIEVSLFLAITAMLFIITLIGTGNTIRTTRFSDSTRSLTSYFQKSYDDLVNGVNSRGSDQTCVNGTVTTGGSTTQSPGTSSCILMGKLIEFDISGTQARTFNVVGTTPVNPSYDALAWDAVVINSYNPKVVRATAGEAFQIPWGAFVSNTKRDNGLAFDTVLFIYNPVTSEVETDLFKRPNNSFTDLTTFIDPSNPANWQNVNQVGSICINSADGDTPGSRVYLGGDLHQSSIQFYYDVKPEDCNGT